MYNEIHNLKGDHLMSFNKCIHLYNLNPYKDIKHYHYPRKFFHSWKHSFNPKQLLLWFCFCHWLVLPVPYKWIHIVSTHLCKASLSLMFSRYNHVAILSMICSFILLSTILFSACTSVSLDGLLLINIWAFFNFWLFWISFYEYWYIDLSVNICFQFLGKYLGVKLLGHKHT